MAVQYLGDGNSDGTCLGLSATEKLGFYGTTPVVQTTVIAAVATTAITTAAITTTTNSYGFATTTQANDLMAIVAANRTAINALLVGLKLQGLVASA